VRIMIDNFHHIANELALDPGSLIEKGCSRGRPVIGHTCAFVPEEILMALDMTPFRIHGNRSHETTIGDTYFGPFICSLPKALLQVAGEGGFRFLDGVVIEPGCDSMRRLDECWRKAAEDIAGIVPSFFFHLAVPHKPADFSIDYFARELKQLIQALEAHFGVTLSDTKLSRAIELCNRSRTLLNRFQSLRNRAAAPVTGADAMAVFLAQAGLPRETFNARLEELLETAPALPDRTSGKHRILLLGSAADDVGFIRTIEGERAVVVGDNLCVGIRPPEKTVMPGADPVRALAAHYLERCRCPRMFGDFERRKAALTKLATDAGADGIVFQNIRFCDLHGSENGLLERIFEKAGVPCLRLEREYGPLAEAGRLRMRLDAFMERLDRKGRHEA